MNVTTVHNDLKQTYSWIIDIVYFFIITSFVLDVLESCGPVYAWQFAETFDMRKSIYE